MSHESSQHPATPAHRQRARERGDIAVSREFTAAVAVAGALVLCGCLAGWFWTNLKDAVRQSWPKEVATGQLPTAGDLVARYAEVIAPVALVCIVLFVVAAGLGWLQSGMGFFWDRLTPSWSPGNREDWAQRSFRGAWGMLRSIVVIGSVVGICWLSRLELIRLMTQPGESLLAAWLGIGVRIILPIALLIVVLGWCDWLFQRWRWEQRLKMTDQELRDDLRTAAIDPYVAERRSRDRGTANSLLHRVRSADLFVTDDTGRMIGVGGLQRSSTAAQIVLVAESTTAIRARQIAERFRIPVVSDISRATALAARSNGDYLNADSSRALRRLWQQSRSATQQPAA